MMKKQIQYWFNNDIIKQTSFLKLIISVWYFAIKIFSLDLKKSWSSELFVWINQANRSAKLTNSDFFVELISFPWNSTKW